MKKVLFIDRDGTLIAEPADEQVDNLDKLEFLPGVITALSLICRETDYELVMVTNQDGLGTSSFPEEAFWSAHNKIISILSGEGINFKKVFIDRTFPEAKAATRKPGTALLTGYLASGIDLPSSFVIGDRITDLELAKNLGCKAIFINRKRSKQAVLSTTDWDEVYRYLRFSPRISYFLTPEFCLPDQIRPAPEINRYVCQRIIHWKDKGIPLYSFFASECIRKCFSKRNGHILNGVMLIGFKITLHPNIKIYIAVPWYLFKKMVKVS